MHNVKVLRTPRFEPDSGIEHISRTSTSRLPVMAREQVLPADGAEPAYLDRLYPSESLDAFINRRLQPTLFYPDLQLPAGFRHALIQTRQRLQTDAAKHPAAARRFGKLSLLLDEHDALCALARMYYSGLLQG